jgi:very-short-patch-repair endonuclease
MSEARIWSWLRDRRFGNFKFRRQHPIGEYVVDFYCRKLGLVIEVDGQQHESAGVGEIDDVRTQVLNGYGLEVVRISNRSIATDALLVEQTIAWAIERARTRMR